MPKLVMTHITSPLVVSTTRGTSYVFKPNEPTPVQPEDVKVCQGKGAGLVNPELARAEKGNMPVEKRVLGADEVEGLLTKLFGKMIDSPEKYRGNFTATGRPNARWVADEIGQEVAAQEIDRVWRIVVQDKSSA